VTADDAIDKLKNRERQQRFRDRHHGCPEMQRANEERQQGYALLREKGVPFEQARRRPVARQALLEFIDRERAELGEMGWTEVAPGLWAWRET
jgi:hypothetical protein